MITSHGIHTQIDPNRESLLLIPPTGTADAFITVMPSTPLPPSQRAQMMASAKKSSIDKFGGTLGIFHTLDTLEKLTSAAPLPWTSVPTNGFNLSADTGRKAWLEAAHILDSNNTYIYVDKNEIMAAYYTMNNGAEICHHTYKLTDESKSTPTDYTFTYKHDSVEHTEIKYITIQHHA